MDDGVWLVCAMIVAVLDRRVKWYREWGRFAILAERPWASWSTL